MSPQGPRRLQSFAYTGPYAYLVTMCARGRAKVFLNGAIAREAIAHLLRLSSEEHFALPAYCLMPDHAHLLAAGTAVNADLQSLLHKWKTATGFEWKRQHGHKMWQRGFHDRVLRTSDRMLAVARYVLMNPVRAGLVERAEDYPFSGSTEYSIETILAADEWTPS